jgi:hypothetical protein
VGRYLDIADTIPRTEPTRQGADPTDSLDLKKPESEADTENARRLLEAGWKPKVSFFERVIWERPDTGFYRSEEAAICLLELNRSGGRP